MSACYTAGPTVALSTHVTQLQWRHQTWARGLSNWKLGQDKTKLSCLVCNCVHTADADKTRQFCLVRVGGVNKLL